MAIQPVSTLSPHHSPSIYIHVCAPCHHPVHTTNNSRLNLNPNPGAPPPPAASSRPASAVDLQRKRYNTLSPYEIGSPPRFQHPMMAIRPHGVNPSILTKPGIYPK
ncbi:hypothetical protein GALMADRAFT_256384 [Galerina marginata CBS 339.88]|uniref:Uncharacterized protein n=1 Tax=Galerina marginata (strain CBS 339.88) TaxID=685588 RepID=A0A067SFW2_GALM3|nr:hypothetical protein GALMADRAFT_256384 [Galerina marginata CBS 339.88]